MPVPDTLCSSIADNEITPVGCPRWIRPSKARVAIKRVRLKADPTRRPWRLHRRIDCLIDQIPVELGDHWSVELLLREVIRAGGGPYHAPEQQAVKVPMFLSTTSRFESMLEAYRSALGIERHSSSRCKRRGSTKCWHFRLSDRQTRPQRCDQMAFRRRAARQEVVCS